VAGGRHPGWGTANRIVPLGEEYVELVAVVDHAEAAASDFGRVVMRAAGDGDRFIGWAVATDDLQSIARRHDLDIVGASRGAPDGSTLRWRLAGIAHAMATGAFPFFIEWDMPAALHPARAAASHRSAPRGIVRVDLGADERALASWLGEHQLPLRISEGRQGLVAVTVETSAGQIVLR
jgi:Glyoxalase-like domain